MKSIQPFHTFQLKAAVKEISELTEVSQLSRFFGLKNNKDFLVLGSGSNSVFIGDFEGEVLLNKLRGITVNETEAAYVIDVAGGEDWHEFVTWCTDQGYYGLENLALIPGTVGACPIQNIGAYGVEVAKFISRVDYFDLVTGDICSLTNDECLFAYRESIFKGKLKYSAVITQVQFTIPKSWSPVTTYGELSSLNTPTAKDIFNKVCEVRNQKLPDPKLLGNAGSFFKNPVVEQQIVAKLKAIHPSMPTYPVSEDKSKLAAGWLIDQSGLKGFQLGSVGVHSKQALVLVNKTNQGTGKELMELATHIQQVVLEKFGIVLEPEVRMFGELK